MNWDTFRSSDPKIKKILRDFRDPERQHVYRIKMENTRPSSLLAKTENDRLVLVEKIPYSHWNRPTFLFRWIEAARLPYLAITLFPLLMVFCISWESGILIPWTKLALVFCFLTSIQISASFWGEVEDHWRGVDLGAENTGGSGVIRSLWIPAIHLRYAAMGLMILALSLGAILLWILPDGLLEKHIWWMGPMGVIGAASYSGWPFHYKYSGLGEPIVFFLTGPILTIAVSLLLLDGALDMVSLTAYSIPLALLAVLRLHLGNTQRMPPDKAAGARTIALFLGFSKSIYGALFLFFAPFLWILGMTATSLVSPFKLLSLLLLPLGLVAVRPLLELRSPLDPLFHELRNLATRLHLGFGLLYSLLFLLK